MRSKVCCERTTEAVGVIGAGPAGLAAAYTLAGHGRRVEVLEASAAVGGMARSFRLWDRTVDLGPHRFFSADARVNRLWLEVVGDGYRMVDRLTRIVYDGRLFDYPLRAENVAAELGLRESARCALSYLVQRLRPPHRSTGEESFEEWTRARFGDRLYERFFKSYTEKVWGLPCSEIHADFAAQRIRGLSLFEAVRNAITRGNRKAHATLIDRFAYPVAGTGSVYETMASRVREAGGEVRLRSPVRAVRPAGDHVEVELDGGETRRFSEVVSSMPLTHLLRGMPEVPDPVRRAAAGLRFRNTILVYLLLDADELFPDQWIYVHSPELAVGRITNFRNWVPELHEGRPGTILSLELWCDPDSDEWRRDDAAHAERATSDLESTGLARRVAPSRWRVVRVPRCYPVYDRGYRRRLEQIERFLDAVPRLHVIGRAGSFKYNNQDHSLLMGLLAAERILFGRRHDLWRVNTDDAYQEAAVIDATGLVPVAG